MAERTVKVPRTPGRRTRSTETRRRIVDVALDAFAQRGYASTTLHEIADAAGVHVQTIYLAFGSKAGLLAAVIERLRAAGDDENLPPTEFPWAQELLATRDPRKKLRLLAGHTRRVAPTAGPVDAALRSAARDDAELAAVRAKYAGEQYDGMRALAQALHDLGALRAGLDVERAADTLWALTASHESYELLVGERGWSPDEYERWLGDLLCDALLGPEPARRKSGAASHRSAGEGRR